ncbi:RlpA-like double-psi beta-barrel-protein domain-containing protein-containing protein [Syncephalis fuscata]|nr:RlpA-like double-psi beta-barrel-protein domain-containing protein-containing protein [Syncephalis fuscata]
MYFYQFMTSCYGSHLILHSLNYVLHLYQIYFSCFITNTQHFNMHTLSLISIAIASVAGLMAVNAASVSNLRLTGKHSGSASFYILTGGYSTCGTIEQGGRPVAGISPSYFTTPNPNKDPWCSKCVKVTGPKGSVVVHIVDKCMSCGPDDINLSEGAFKVIGDTDDGRVPATWEEAPCA